MAISEHFASVLKVRISILVSIIGFLPSCSTHTGTGALAGAGVGAVAGTAIGGDEKSTVGGALIGATVGALIGAGADANRVEGQTARQRKTPVVRASHAARPPQSSHAPPGMRKTRLPQITAPPHPAQRRPMNRQAYPVAQRTAEHGIVISPHPPNKKVNVRNFSPGSIVVDPTSKKRFRVP